jgi:predicted nucleic acid-binding protein
MKVAVKDACVLIDLANGGLLDAWFQLGIETFTTDFVLRQVRTEYQWKIVSPFVEAGSLKVETLSGDQIERMNQTLADLRIGVDDQSVLFLAIERKAVLITGDRRLRIEGGKHNIDVRGLLWVLDELVARGIIQPALAAVRLRLMRENGAWLPNDECDERFRRWTPDKPAR